MKRVGNRKRVARVKERGFKKREWCEIKRKPVIIR